MFRMKMSSMPVLAAAWLSCVCTFLKSQLLCSSMTVCYIPVFPACAGIGITNQRETTILWDKDTGEPLYNAVVWCDNRAAKLAEEMIALTPGRSKDFFQVCDLL